jgi:hypothetical protein
MDLLERFPLAWCRACKRVQPISLEVSKADEKNDHNAADIICAKCESIIATLHAPSDRGRGARTKKFTKASEMAARELDRLIDPAAPDEERQRRKRRLIKGPKEFQDIRRKR